MCDSATFGAINATRPRVRESLSQGVGSVRWKEDVSAKIVHTRQALQYLTLAAATTRCYQVCCDFACILAETVERLRATRHWRQLIDKR